METKKELTHRIKEDLQALIDFFEQTDKKAADAVREIKSEY